MAKAGPNPLEADRMSGYLVFLFLLLSSATLFEGFDSGMLSFAAPETRATLDIDLEQWGFINGFTRLGMMGSFLFLLTADRLGRRQVMLITIVGFTVANGLTAFVTDKYQFALLQFAARLFLTAEYSLAVIMIGEEFPSRMRGAAIAILTSLATVGVMLIAKVQPYLLLSEGSPGNWLHDFSAGIVATGQGLVGLEADGANWRALYLLGLFPLVVVFGLRMGMRETRRFQAVQLEGEETGGAASVLRAGIRSFRVVWGPRYRRRTAIVTLLWNCVHLVTAPSVVYWVIFAREDLGLTAFQVGDIVFWGYGGGVAGHFVAGYLIERLGRKWTCSGFYFLAAFSIYQLYHVPSLSGQYVWMIGTVFSFGAAMTATHVYASELFPTEIRATGYGWTTNLLGRITEVVTPVLIGALIVPLGGIPNAIAVVAIGPVVGGLLVLAFAPETRGLTLEQIQEQLSPGAEPTPRDRARDPE
ncbi:MAG: MFS transporter [Myxococcales bacterium]|nr:MFS transporter [Myxococcales bacterium]